MARPRCGCNWPTHYGRRSHWGEHRAHSISADSVDPPITTETRIAILEFVLRLLLFAAVAAIGLTTLLLGLVLTGGLVTWAPLAPLAILAVMIAPAWYARWLLKRLRP